MLKETKAQQEYRRGYSDGIRLARTEEAKLKQEIDLATAAAKLIEESCLVQDFYWRS